MKPGANNCGLFCADNVRTGLILEDFEIDDQAGCPNGAIWFPNRPGDTGLVEIGYRRCNFKGVTHMPAGIDYSGGGTTTENPVLGRRLVQRLESGTAMVKSTYVLLVLIAMLLVLNSNQAMAVGHKIIGNG